MRSRSDRKRARDTDRTIVGLEQAGIAFRVPAGVDPIQCDGARRIGCPAERLAVYLIQHGEADSYYVCLACMVHLVHEHIDQLSRLRRASLAL